MKLWDKGYSIDDQIEKFTVGNDREVDIHIAKYDIQASLAHAKMLHSINILNDEEIQVATEGLLDLYQQCLDGAFNIDSQFEDVHSKIEFDLTQKYGNVGKKIHTARSRNDQVLVALHLYYKENLLEIKSLIHNLFNTLLNLAQRHKQVLLPGYTHLQIAMPSSFGLWLSAYAEILVDDVNLLNAAIKSVDQNPLGSAAGYGSSFPIDRRFTTKELGFDTLKYNVVAAQMSRGKSERTISAALGSVGNTLARFAMDVCLYAGQNFGFISFPKELTTGSSIMPHKKNPDVFELIRAKSNKIQALQTEMILITNNLPSGYHRDFQLLKENMINAIEDMKSILAITEYCIQHMQVHEFDIKDEKYKYLFTVDNINNLVVEGMSFREAYQQIGSEIEREIYLPDTSKKHTHLGSIHNLCLREIRQKFPK